MTALGRSTRELQGALARSLAAMDLRTRVAAALPARPPRSVSVIAIGKAAPSMASGVLDAWRERIAELVVVTSDGTDPLGLTVLRAGHPLPDRRSVAAGRRCLDAAARASFLLVLVSGGASAMVCAPAPGVTLSDKRRIARAMLASGAPIQSINVVRKHLSAIKGGGLARAAPPNARVLTLAGSDVIGGAVGDIGSGPSVADASTVADARRLVLHWAPELAALPLARTGRSRIGTKARARILASPEELARAFATELRVLGYRVLPRPPSQAPVDALAAEYLRARLSPGTAIVRAAEPGVAVGSHERRTGRGGRSTHLAALVGRALPEGYVFLAAATDGVDGTSGTAGAIVETRLDREAADRAIAAWNTGPLHRDARTALQERPTGHNLADVHVLLRPR